MKIFFFGGSFDPPHLGHLEIIKFCINFCDKLILFPSAHSPFKSVPTVAPRHRVKMLELMLSELNFFIEIDHWEIEQGGMSYTYKTVNYLLDKYPNAEITMVIGYDQLENFQDWKNYKEILKVVKIISFNRGSKGNFLYNDIPIKFINNFEIDISSTVIRSDLKKRKLFISGLIPSVYNYINKNRLYIDK